MPHAASLDRVLTMEHVTEHEAVVMLSLMGSKLAALRCHRCHLSLQRHSEASQGLFGKAPRSSEHSGEYDAHTTCDG
jgi:hypothetical protein